MSATIVEALWSKLDPQTQEWIRANPGTVILPRTVAKALARASGRHDSLEGVDRNGQLPLSPGTRLSSRPWPPPRRWATLCPR